MEFLSVSRRWMVATDRRTGNRRQIITVYYNVTDPRGCFPLVLVFVALEGHLSSVLALLLPESWIEALRVRVGDIFSETETRGRKMLRFGRKSYQVNEGSLNDHHSASSFWSLDTEILANIK